jgi:hypothetical protein
MATLVALVETLARQMMAVADDDDDNGWNQTAAVVVVLQRQLNEANETVARLVAQKRELQRQLAAGQPAAVE